MRQSNSAVPDRTSQPFEPVELSKPVLSASVFLLLIASRGACLACVKVEAFRDSGRACRLTLRLGETRGGVSTAMIVQMTADVLGGHQHVSNGTVTAIPDALRC